MNDLDLIVRRLSAITDEILALGTDSFARRFELESERDQVRKDAQAFHEGKDERRTIFELEAELSSRRKQLESINSSKINMLYQAQNAAGHTMSISAKYGGTINNAMMKAQGGDTLITRIGELETELKRRGRDVTYNR